MAGCWLLASTPDDWLLAAYNTCIGMDVRVDVDMYAGRPPSWVAGWTQFVWKLPFLAARLTEATQRRIVVVGAAFPYHRVNDHELQDLVNSSSFIFVVC